MASDLDRESSEHIVRRHEKTKKSLPTISPMEMNIMMCLMKENELNTKNLSIMLDVHQSSISHALRDLIEEYLVAKTSHGYKLTNLGKVKMDLMVYMKEAFESLEQNRNFILAHDVADIPINYLTNLGTICRQREYQIGDASTPYRNQEYLVEHLNDCRELRCMPSAVTSDHVKSITNAVINKKNVEIIISDRVLQTLRKHYASYLLKDALGYKNLKIYRIKDANFSLWVTESNLFLGLHRFDGCFDLENLIICKSESGLEWGNMLFDYYRKKGKVLEPPQSSS